MIRFSKEIKDFIKSNAKGIGNQDLTNMINKQFKTNFTINQIKCFKTNNHISSGLNGCFNKGHEPFNKGKKWDEYMPKETQKKCKQTCFTKDKNINQQRHNWKENGTERTTKDGYIEIRIAKNKWKLKHRYIYEKEHGKIPKGFAVIFADQDKRNFDINNLVLVSRNELLQMNKNDLVKDCAAATKSGVILAKYIIKINELKEGV